MTIFEDLIPDPLPPGVEVLYGTVTGTSPLRVKVDRDPSPLGVTPTSTVPVGTGDRVVVLTHPRATAAARRAKAVTVIGVVGRGLAVPTYTLLPTEDTTLAELVEAYNDLLTDLAAQGMITLTTGGGDNLIPNWLPTSETDWSNDQYGGGYESGIYPVGSDGGSYMASVYDDYGTVLRIYPVPTGTGAPELPAGTTMDASFEVLTVKAASARVGAIWYDASGAVLDTSLGTTVDLTQVALASSSWDISNRTSPYNFTAPEPESVFEASASRQFTIPAGAAHVRPFADIWSDDHLLTQAFVSYFVATVA